jgi:hypothetical protein
MAVASAARCGSPPRRRSATSALATAACAAAGQPVRSSEWAERCFCKQCGTPLFYRLIAQNQYFVSAEALDDRAGYTFTSQIFIDEKPGYYDFANKTQNMTGAEVFAAFAPPSGGQG